MLENLKLKLFKNNNTNNEEDSDPVSIIPIKNLKYIKNTHEIYWGYRKISYIKNFDNFIYLEVLWLNNNNIQKIEGLDKNFRLKELYLHNNKINTLNGSLNNLIYLEIISVYNNKINNLQNCISILEKISYLKELQIFDNPVMQEPNAKFKLINYVKTLINLNKRSILIRNSRWRENKK